MAKTYVIDGVTYVEVERKAKPGEKIIVIADWYDIKKGEILFVISPQKYGFYDEGDTYIESETNKYNDTISFIAENNYRVLVEVGESCEEPTVDTSQASPAVIEMFAALSQKVVALEKALASVERKNDSLEAQLRATQRNVETFAEQTESNSEDIRTLDERTQIINAITKFYEEANR